MTRPTTRRDEIADAAISIIDRAGLRGLTHRAVDSELGLPAGSTSYYARTRSDLINLVVAKLAERTTRTLATLELSPVSREGIAAAVATGAARLLADPRNQRARFALLLDPEATYAPGGLEDSSMVRPHVQAAAERALTELAIADAGRRTHELLTLIDGLVMQAAVRGLAVDFKSIVLAYLSGCQPTSPPA